MFYVLRPMVANHFASKIYFKRHYLSADWQESVSKGFNDLFKKKHSDEIKRSDEDVWLSTV